MRAAVIHQFNGVEGVEIEEIPTPTAGPGEVLIAIEAAGVNPVDWKVAEGLLKHRIDYTFPITLGWECAGTVADVGADVTHLQVGDPVFAECYTGTIHAGSFAETIALPGTQVVKKPANLTFTEAASIPLACLTAWQALLDATHLKKGETVLIQAGAGGVGGFALQIAKHFGAHVVTSARFRNHAYVAMLGADRAIDYAQEDLVETVLRDYPQGVDVLFDTVGGDALTHGYKMVKQGGRLVSIAGAIDQALVNHHHVHATYLFVQPSGPQLTEIASLFENGTFKLPALHTFPFEQAEQALRTNREGHTQGKIVLTIGENP